MEKNEETTHDGDRGAARARTNLRAVLIEVNEVGAVALRVGRRVGRLVGREVHESGYAVP